MAKTTIEISDEKLAELEPYRDKLGELLLRTEFFSQASCL